jgi:hypothetical protein
MSEHGKRSCLGMGELELKRYGLERLTDWQSGRKNGRQTAFTKLD